MYEIPLFSQKVLNSEEINCDPLSETIDLGIPCRLNNIYILYYVLYMMM